MIIIHNVKIGDKTSEIVSDKELKKIYVGCAESDIRYRDMLVNGRHSWESHSKHMIDFITLERQDVRLASHKRTIDTAIRGVDGVMIIVSDKTSTDPVALWEIDHALLYGIPIVGVDVRPKPVGIVPTNLEGKIIKFGWEWFIEFLNAL